jgi:hypothetical protein
MAIISNFVIAFLRNGEVVYLRLRKKYLKFLPSSPVSKFPIFTKELFRLKTKIIAQNFDPIIQDELEWYNQVHYNIEDSQESIDIANICKFLMNTENIKGDILELGTERAGLAIIMAHFLKKIGSKKKIFGCDTFEGFPYDDKYSLDLHKKGLSAGFEYEQIVEKIKKYDVEDKIVLVKGMFEETLYQQLEDKQFSFVFVDCNLYDSTKFGLEFAHPRMPTDAIVAFDEYEHESKGTPYFGETKAANEFCEKTNSKINLIPIPHLIKK